MNEKYNAGIVDPEFYLTTDDTLAKGKFVSGQCATYSFYMSSGTDVFSSLLANDPNARSSRYGFYRFRHGCRRLHRTLL